MAPLSLGAASAHAAFPGQNGKIAFEGDLGRSNLELFAIEPGNPEGPTTRLTENRATDRSPAFSSDGRVIAFASDRSGDFDIYLMGADGSCLTRLTRDPGDDSEPALSPDGKRIAFESTRDGDGEIYTMRSDGSGLVRLTNNLASNSNPTFSPDGKKIAFQALRNGDFQVYTMRSDGSRQQRLTSRGTNFGPDFSPDGQRIAFSRYENGGSVYVMNADGSGQTQLRKGGGQFAGTEIDQDPVFSPDGRQIALSRLSFREGFDIYTMNTDGSGPTNRTESAGSDLRPSWGPSPTSVRPALSGHVRSRSLGPVGLGRTRAQNRRSLTARTDRRRSTDTACVSGGGQLQIGYPNIQLVRSLPARERRRVRGRAALIATSSRSYSLRGVSPGSSLNALRRRFRSPRRVRVGQTSWYLERGRISRPVFGVRDGRVREIGIADPQLSRSHRWARNLFRSFR